jgi:hypothetical protein
MDHTMASGAEDGMDHRPEVRGSAVEFHHFQLFVGDGDVVWRSGV